MRIEIRRTQVHNALVPRGLVLVAECLEESALIDEVFGSRVVDGDGLIARRTVEVEVRLADGYGDHYIYLKAPHAVHQADTGAASEGGHQVLRRTGQDGPVAVA